MSAPSPTEARMAPEMSSFPVAISSRDSGMYRLLRKITRAAIGMLIRKTNRQPHGATPTSRPPRIGPKAVATPPNPDQAPTAVDRSSLRNDACRIANDPGVQQCRAGALQRTHGDQHLGTGRQRAADRRGGEPQHAGDEHPPPAEPVAERAAEQEQPGQGQGVGVEGPLQAGQPPPRSSPIRGSATFTTVPSSWASPLPRTVAVSTQRPRGVP